MPPPVGLGESAKIKKGGRIMAQGQAFLIFSRFIIFTLKNYATLWKVVSYIWRKVIFFCHYNFMEKGHSKLSKNEPENTP